jgi:type II secretory pathway pseudopilin PulG
MALSGGGQPAGPYRPSFHRLQFQNVRICLRRYLSQVDEMKKDRGFRRLELSVLVIVVLIAFVAIPKLIRSRKATRESAALAGIRAINGAEVTYLSIGGRFGDVAQLIDAGLLDPRFATSVSGYSFAITTSGLDYTVSATPAAVNGGRAYYSASDAVIRQFSPRT